MRSQSGVDLGDQLALPVARAQFDRAIGFRRCTIGKVRMIDVFFLQCLQGESSIHGGFLPSRPTAFAREIFALPVVHERLFFGGAIAFQLVQGQSIFACKAPEMTGRAAAYIARSCDRQ
jgi:hypothetical protein